MPQGFVYVLASPNSNFIKIGGTERSLRERLQGPWELSGFLHVTD